jgi:CBS domain-containing protein
MKNTPFGKMTATDIMQRDLIVVYDRDTLRDAMELMTANHVTGLPVVNKQGVCVGIISSSDILNYEQDHSEAGADDSEHVAHHFNPETQQWETIRVTSFALGQFGDVRVDEVMTAELISVAPEASLRDVARTMRDGRVHRVLVLNHEQRLLGIITSSDFVRLFADADLQA